MPTNLELAIMSEDIYHNMSKLKSDWVRETGNNILKEKGFYAGIYFNTKKT